MARPSSLLHRNPFCLLASLVGFTLLSIGVPATKASPCVIFDANFNLYAFGFGGKDYKLGTQDTWSSTISPMDITSTGRPPFDGPQTTCYLSQFFNAIYVLDGDTSNPSAVHIYDAQGASWSTQAVSAGGPDPKSLVAILDHDTNVFYALANGEMSSLDLGQQKKANATPLTWNDVGKPSFDTTNYQPTMALAQNHIHFIGVPQSPQGNAFIFVIHFSFFQPDPQSYPASAGGSTFPSTHGQTASFFKSQGVQQEFAFIPDDASNTYVINVENNSTVLLAGPSDKTPSTYTASINALVQLTSSGSIYFLPYNPGNTGQTQSASWSKINVQGLAVISGNSSSSNSTHSGGAGGGAGAGSGTATAAVPSGTSGTGKSQNGAVSMTVSAGVITLLSGAWAVTLAMCV